MMFTARDGMREGGGPNIECCDTMAEEKANMTKDNTARFLSIHIVLMHCILFAKLNV